MENEQILTVVVIIAVAAVVGRIIINRQQKGGINWAKVIAIVLAAVVFVGIMLGVDSYRLATCFAGSVDSEEDLSAGHVVGRPAGAVVHQADGVSDGLPIFFTLKADSVSPTGYYMLKEGAAEKAVDRQILVSQSDSTRTAIKRTTSTFAITRHPARESDYTPIFRLSVSNGEKVLCVMTDYDAEALAEPIVMTSHVLTGKMQNIASRDTALNQMVYVSAFDHGYYAASATERLLYSATVALAATIVVGAIAFGIFRKTKR